MNKAYFSISYFLITDLDRNANNLICFMQPYEKKFVSKANKNSIKEFELV